MINFTNKQKRYVVTPTVPEGTVLIDYYIYWGQTNTPVYSGKSRFFGEFEVDLTDWVEWVYSKYSINGALLYNGDLIVDFVFIDEDGIEHQGPEDRYLIPVEKDDPMIAYAPSLRGIVDIEAPLNRNVKPVVTPGRPFEPADSFGVWIYPVFFLEDTTDGRMGMLDTACLATSYGEQERSVNMADFWTSDSPHSSGTIDFTEDITGLLDRYSAFSAATTLHLNGFQPTIFFEDGTSEVLDDPLGFEYMPFFSDWDLDGYDIGEGRYSRILRHPYTLRYTEDSIRRWFQEFIPEEIREGYRLAGFGYSVIYIYPQYIRAVGSNANPMRIDYHLVGGPLNEDACPWFNLLLVNSDFQGDINVPLVVTNGTLMGRTANNLDKISFMDRYGDTHNSSISNSYELDCYVDPSWLKTTTGNDIGYEALMLAMQSARRTHLIGTARISGMRTDDLTLLNCRVKDVEKVETYSRYNGTHRVPSLKITIEIYK